MPFQTRSQDATRFKVNEAGASTGESIAGFDVTKLQASGAEFSSIRGNQSRTVDTKTLPPLLLFDSAEKGSAPMTMAYARGGEKEGLFGRIRDKVKDVGEKTVDGAKKVGEKTVEGAKKAGEKTTEVAKKSTGNDQPYSPRQLESQVEKALNKHDPRTRRAIHETLEKMSDAEKDKLYKDVQKYNAEVSAAKTGTKYGGILGGGPLGGVIGAKSSEHVGKVIPEPGSLKSFKRQVNEKLRH